MTIKTHSAGIQHAYSGMLARRRAMIVLMFGLLLISFLLDVATGPGQYPLTIIFEVLIDPMAHGARLKVIVWDYRLPVAVTAAVVGALLAVAGAQMQTILNNPLAEPFTLGVSAAASFGASLSIVLGISIIPAVGPFLVTVNAFVFALTTCGLILLATRIKGVGSETMILFGIAIFFTFSALLALMQYMASEDQIARIVFWMMGSLSRASWEKIALGGMLLAVAIPFSLIRTWPMTGLRMGEVTAASMGVDVARLRVEMLVCISLLAATAVSFVGTVGFVGLVGPHIARMLVGEDQRYLVPLAAIVGALVSIPI
ncbi:MAG: iron ABC transporter permease [Candidatus Poribacteria bacterium]|nr:iron ABC transporter permease [Candidatus Poribacteria bacterium]